MASSEVRGEEALTEEEHQVGVGQAQPGHVHHGQRRRRTLRRVVAIKN